MTDDALALFLLLFGVLVFGIAGIVAKVFAHALSDDPEMVLRRCRAQLHFIRKQLERIPATREVHQVLAEVDGAERAINAKIGGQESEQHAP